MKTFNLRAISLAALLLISGLVMANNTALTSGTWENGANWSSGAAPVATDNVIIPAGISMTVNVVGDLCASLTIANTGSVSIIANKSLAIGGSLSNAGTFTVAAGSTLTFNGAANSTVTGGGNYTIAGTIVLNMGSAATALDVQDANFITGINSGGNYYFTFTKGTWRMDNAGTLNDSYNSGSTNALTIPFGVVIESDNGTMNLAKFGTMATIGNGTSSYGQSNIILSGELYVNGGTVDVALGQPPSSNSGQTLSMGVDLQYYAKGGTPQLNVTSGTLNLGAGFDYYTTNDYIIFNMTGGTIVAAVAGSSYMGTFQLNDHAGGQTVMTGGLIELTDASWGVYPDVDLGGTNVQSVKYSVTGGTVQFGSPLTANAGTYFAFEAWSTTNYPNFAFEPGMSKIAQPLNNSDFRMYSLTANSNMTFNVADYITGNSTKNMYIDGNNGSWAFDDEGGFVPGTSTVHFIGTVNQMLNSSTQTSTSFYNLVMGTLSGAFASVSGSLNTINVGGSLTVSSGTFSPGTMTTLNVTGTTTLGAGTLTTAPATINESANWTNNGGNFTPNGGVLNFNGTGNQVINGTAATQTFYNVTTNMTAGQTLSTGGSTTAVAVNGNLTETTGNITAPAKLTVVGNVLLSSGTFTAGTNTFVGGNFTNNSNAFFANSNTVTFNGSAAQTIGGGFSSTFYNMTVANSAGHVILGIPTFVSNQFAFTLGMLDASNDPLTITSGLAVTGASTNSYVIVGNGVSTTGLLTIDNLPANTATAFPIGTTTHYLPATLNPGANTGNGFSTYVFTPAAYNAVFGGPAFGAAMAAGILNVVWNVSQSAGTGSATLGLNWASTGTTLDGSSFKTAGTNIGISQYVGGGWQTATGSGNVATESATSTFGTFTQFLVNTQNFALPVEITDFNAILNSNNTVGLTWTTSTVGFSSFDVQRSNNGTDWTTIGLVAAATADGDGQYSFTDQNPFAGVNYYRLLGQQTDGGASYSTIRTVGLSGMAAIGIYPNPTADRINVSVSNATPDLRIRLVSLSGQVLQSIMPGATGASVTTISVQHYPAAIYLVQLVNSEKVLQVSTVIVTH
jgi:hypothetical protein